MDKGGAPKGNQNARKGKLWTDAIQRALKIWENESRVDGKKALDALAMQLLEKCLEGDMTALKELGDRLEGKPAQSVYVGEAEDNPHYIASDEPLSDDEWIKQYGSVETSKGSAKVTH